MTTDTATPNATTATGPRTDDGKRIAARNATTHGLFARDVVLTHLGEDPQGYEALLAELTAQLSPKNLLERHYTEKIAAASWRLRRLHRWQAQLFEDPKLTEDEALSRLDRVMRHETTLHRQIDMSVKMLARELPRLFQDRAREEALDYLGATEDYCARNPGTGMRVAARERDLLDRPVTPPGLDLTRLDNCQNEPAPVAPPPPPTAEEAPGGDWHATPSEPETAPPAADGTQNRQKEPAARPTPPAPGATLFAKTKGPASETPGLSCGGEENYSLPRVLRLSTVA